MVFSNIVKNRIDKETLTTIYLLQSFNKVATNLLNNIKKGIGHTLSICNDSNQTHQKQSHGQQNDLQIPSQPLFSNPHLYPSQNKDTNSIHSNNPPKQQHQNTPNEHENSLNTQNREEFQIPDFDSILKSSGKANFKNNTSYTLQKPSNTNLNSKSVNPSSKGTISVVQKTYKSIHEYCVENGLEDPGVKSNKKYIAHLVEGIKKLLPKMGECDFSIMRRVNIIDSIHVVHNKRLFENHSEWLPYFKSDIGLMEVKKNYIWRMVYEFERTYFRMVKNAVVKLLLLDRNFELLTPLIYNNADFEEFKEFVSQLPSNFLHTKLYESFFEDIKVDVLSIYNLDKSKWNSLWPVKTYSMDFGAADRLRCSNELKNLMLRQPKKVGYYNQGIYMVKVQTLQQKQPIGINTNTNTNTMQPQSSPILKDNNSGFVDLSNQNAKNYNNAKNQVNANFNQKFNPNKCVVNYNQNNTISTDSTVLNSNPEISKISNILAFPVNVVKPIQPIDSQKYAMSKNKIDYETVNKQNKNIMSTKTNANANASSNQNADRIKEINHNPLPLPLESPVVTNPNEIGNKEQLQPKINQKINTKETTNIPKSNGQPNATYQVKDKDKNKEKEKDIGIDKGNMRNNVKMTSNPSNSISTTSTSKVNKSKTMVPSNKKKSNKSNEKIPQTCIDSSKEKEKEKAILNTHSLGSSSSYYDKDLDFEMDDKMSSKSGHGMSNDSIKSFGQEFSDMNDSQSTINEGMDTKEGNDHGKMDDSHANSNSNNNIGKGFDKEEQERHNNKTEEHLKQIQLNSGNDQASLKLKATDANTDADQTKPQDALDNSVKDHKSKVDSLISMIKTTGNMELKQESDDEEYEFDLNDF